MKTEKKMEEVANGLQKSSSRSGLFSVLMIVGVAAMGMVAAIAINALGDSLVTNQPAGVPDVNLVGIPDVDENEAATLPLKIKVEVGPCEANKIVPVLHDGHWVGYTLTPDADCVRFQKAD